MSGPATAARQLSCRGVQPPLQSEVIAAHTCLSRAKAWPCCKGVTSSLKCAWVLQLTFRLAHSAQKITAILPFACGPTTAVEPGWPSAESLLRPSLTVAANACSRRERLPRALWLSRCRRAYHKRGEAIAEFDKAIELNPQYAKAYYLRANAYYDDGRYGKAWDDVHKAQELGYRVAPRFLDILREVSGRAK